MKKLFSLLLGLLSLSISAQTTPTISIKRGSVVISTLGDINADATINGVALTTALTTAIASDEILLTGKQGSFHGTYAGTFTVSKNIVIKGVDGSAILKPVSSALVVNNRVMNVSSTGAVFENLTITDGNVLNGNGAGANVTAGGNQFKNCLFTNNQVESNGGAPTWGGAFFINANLSVRTYFENCQFINNAAWGNKANSTQAGNDRGFGGAVACSGKISPMTFTNCVFANNFAKTYGGAVASGSGLATEDNVQFINCTVVNNEILDSNNSPALNPASGAGMTVINTVICGNKGGAGQLWAGSGSKYINCAYEGAILGSENLLANCFSLLSNTALFTKPTTEAGFDPTGEVTYDQADWSLSISSYLINRGTDNSATLPKDILGNDRKQMGFIDLGAYESANKGTIGVEISPAQAEIFVGETLPSFTATIYPTYPSFTTEIKGVPTNSNTAGSYPISVELTPAINLDYWNAPATANATLKIKAADVATITLKRGGTTVGIFGNIDGTSEDNGTDLLKVLSTAQANDEILLMAKQGSFHGTYAGAFTVAKGITIKGVGGSAILRPVSSALAANNRVMNVSSTGVTFENLIITGGNLLNENGAGISATVGGNTFKNCLFTNNQVESDGTTPTWGGAFSIPTGQTRTYFENCRFINNAAWGYKVDGTQGGGWGGAVAGLRQSSPMTFTNCVFANNYAKTYGGAFASGNGVSTDDNLQFINCTVVNNKTSTTTQTSALNPAGGQGMTVINTIFQDNIGGSGQLYRGIGSKYINCAYNGGVFGTAATMTDCFELTINAPSFTKPTTEAGFNPSGAVTHDQADWSLSVSSYLINRGTDNSATLPKDILGNDRKQMNVVDVGAYESAGKGNMELSISPAQADIYIGQPIPTFSVSGYPTYPSFATEVTGIPANSTTAGQYPISAALTNSADLQSWNTPTLNNGVLNINVPQPLPTPTNLSIEGQTPYGFTSKWDAVANADTYEVSIFKQGDTTTPLDTATVNTPTYRFHWATPSTIYDLSIVAKSSIFPSSPELKGSATTIAAATTTIEPTAEANTPTSWATAFAGKEPTAESEVVIPADRKIVVDQASTIMRALRIVIPNSGEPALLSLSQTTNVTDALCAEITITDAEKGKWLFRSFPFDVHLHTGVRKVVGTSETNCTYWTDFRTYTYDGERRAQEGYTADNNKVWKEIKAEENYLKKGTGYIFAIATPGTYRIYAAEESLQTVLNPEPKNISLKEIPTTLSQTNGGWNMIGSPILDRYNYSAEPSDNSLPKFLYRYVGGRYELLNALESPFEMKPYSAYLAQAPQTSNWSIAYQAAQQNRSRTTMVSENQISKYQFNLSKNGAVIDKVSIAFNPWASESFVINEDAVKMVYGNETRLWSDLHGEALAYNQLPRIENNSNMTLKAFLAEEATFKIDRLNKSDEYAQILIRNTQTNEPPTDLLTSDYTFKSNSNETKAFEITFKATPTSIGETPTTGRSIYSQGQSLFIQGECDRIEIESIEGQRMATIAQPKSHEIALPKGIYLIRIIKGEEQETIKYKH